MKNINKKTIIIAAAALVIGLAAGWALFGGTGTATDQHEHTEQTEVNETIWTCSMHPQIRQNEPGSCPICGMDLIPVDDGINNSNEAVNPSEIQMSPSAMKLAEVQTYTVERGSSEKAVYLLGKVKPDERNMAALTARFGGRIEKLYVNFTGQQVKKGQKLASLYSPDLITAQRELIEARKYKESNPSFYRSTRSKLKLWGLNDDQIDTIENQGKPTVNFDILSPISGTVTRRDVSIGDYVKEGSPLFKVVNLKKVWVMFDAYESDLPWINKGDTIRFTLRSAPGKTYTGTVTYIDPFINTKTRVAQVRVEMNNNDRKLKPEMFANGILQSTTAENTHQLHIPKTSVLWTGKRAVVYVKVPNRKSTSFVFREITLGPESGNYYVVAGGLNEGEVIASNGVFMIDASAQLAGKPSMMNPQGGKVSTGHNHGGKTMTDEEMMNMETNPSTKTTSDSITVVKYYCPMYCEGDKTYDEPGKCPVCGMFLKKEVPEKSEDSLVTKYYCPMFCEGDKTYDISGKCPVCGMNLKEETGEGSSQHDNHK
jgi:Cu(I)/Ag(I) efflux system membrane fusion protein